jgi:hypothetical protein
VFTLASTNRALRLLLWCALIIGIAITALGVRQVDLWWQLPEGLAILRDGHLPSQPPAAFGLPHRPYVDEYSLYEIALALLYRLGGFIAIWLAFVAAYGLVFAIPLTAARDARRDLVSLGFLILASIFMVNRYEQRPEIVGALLLVWLIQVLRHTRAFSPGFLLRVALLFAIWTNVHSSFLIGLLALIIWLIDRIYFSPAPPHWEARQGAVALGTAVAAVLINPYGWHRVTFSFGQQRDLGSNLLSREMWPAWDQSTLTQSLLLLSALFIFAAFVPMGRPARWLTTLACILLALTVHNIRHMSFFAVALLMLYADRESPPIRHESRNRLLAALLGTACIFTLIFDFTALRNAVAGIITDRARSDRPFAPALVKQLRARGPSAVLCHDDAGSYLTFAGRGELHPILDSGQGHFDDATKRFYFFLEQDPRAFDLALARLDVNAVFVTRPTAAWVLAMTNQPAWHLLAWNTTGLLFARGPAPAPLTEPQRDQLHQLRDSALREKDAVRAFCLSTLIDDPTTSLDLLDRAPLNAWSETLLNFFRPWLDGVPQAALDSFLKSHPNPGNPLLHELVLMRAQPHAPLPPLSSSRLQKMVRVLELLQRGDAPAARNTFATIPHPPLSTLYYQVRDLLYPAAAKNDDPSEKWQDWNAGGADLFQQLSPLLNQRIPPPGSAPPGIR